jgi:predicted RNA-binding protein associated with RNAse of E/G family
MKTVQIHYHRPPARDDIFVQTLVARTPEVLVTFNEETPLPRPVMAADNVILEPGAPAIWFTFPGLWYDIGRFHLADGTFTGIYTNIITPVNFRDPVTWETTDLFLDLWLPPGGQSLILDEDEFSHAIEEGWIDKELEEVARAETARIQERALQGSWPPKVVEEWTLERIRKMYGGDANRT